MPVSDAEDWLEMEGVCLLDRCVQWLSRSTGVSIGEAGKLGS